MHENSLHSRKNEHLRIAHKLNEKKHQNRNYSLDFSNFSTTGLEYVKLIHNALPNINFNEISTETYFLGKKMGIPLLIDAITGGTEQSFKINQNLGKISKQYNIPICVGSQRILLNSNEFEASFKIIRQEAPNQIILANLGISEILQMGDFHSLEKIISVIDADGLVIHLNSLQELIQPNGNRNFQNSLNQLEKLRTSCNLPIIIKEVGFGFSKEVIEKLSHAGFSIFNVAGAGGTNFCAIESIRAKEQGDLKRYALGETFQNWGIPTAASLCETVATVNKTHTIIASGGIRTGKDIGKCLSLGANMCGMAYPFISTQNPQKLKHLIEQVILELQTCMFLLGITKIEDFVHVPKVILPPLQSWINSRLK